MVSVLLSLQHIVFEDGHLHLLCKFENRTYQPLPFLVVKNNFLVLLAWYIKKHVIESSRRGFYSTWAKETLKQQDVYIRPLRQVHRVDYAYKIAVRRLKRAKTSKKLRNACVALFGVREKFGIKIPSTIKEVLLLDKNNRNSN